MHWICACSYVHLFATGTVIAGMRLSQAICLFFGWLSCPKYSRIISVDLPDFWWRFDRACHVVAGQPRSTLETRLSSYSSAGRSDSSTGPIQEPVGHLHGSVVADRGNSKNSTLSEDARCLVVLRPCEERFFRLVGQREASKKLPTPPSARLVSVRGTDGAMLIRLPSVVRRRQSSFAEKRQAEAGDWTSCGRRAFALVFGA